MNLKRPKANYPDFQSEATLGFFASKLVIGVDEVGRGCLAGPVVAGAAVLCPEKILEFGFKTSGLRPSLISETHADSPVYKIRDSKLIPEVEREKLAPHISEFVMAFAIEEASVPEIESLNILYASHLAMERAVRSLEKKLGRKADAILVDGNLIPKALRSCNAHALIKGDSLSISIACAALLAKVYRDRLMIDLESKHPGYGMKSHKGYGTPFHLAQIKSLGVTPSHRRTFKGVAEFVGAREKL